MIDFSETQRDVDVLRLIAASKKDRQIDEAAAHSIRAGYVILAEVAAYADCNGLQS